LWISPSGSVGPVLDLLLDPITHHPQVLVVEHHLANDDEGQMWLDLHASRRPHCRVAPETGRFTREEISGMLAADA
jgi:hypothetical protein